MAGLEPTLVQSRLLTFTAPKGPRLGVCGPICRLGEPCAPQRGGPHSNHSHCVAHANPAPAWTVLSPPK